MSKCECFVSLSAYMGGYPGVAMVIDMVMMVVMVMGSEETRPTSNQGIPQAQAGPIAQHVAEVAV